MSKKNTQLSLVLPPREDGITANHWLSDALRGAILGCQLRPGARLPATRQLASQYGLSRGTIVSAFEQLMSEGYLEGKTGSGTYVTRVLPDRLLEVGRRAREQSAAIQNAPRKYSAYGRRLRAYPDCQTGPARAFRANQPALELFPTALWAQVISRRLREATARQLLGCEGMGYLPLREAVADYLITSRGVRCQPEQVAIISGVQQALDVVVRLFVDPGDRVAIEDPGYLGTKLVLDSLGATVVPMPVDREGMTIDAVAMKGVRLVYVTPAHQFPLGVSMSLSRRLALLDWARKSGALILEDDYDSEFRYSGRPVPALQGLDASGQVIFAGSFSKVMFPSLRLGYLVVPTDLIERVDAMMSITQRHAPLLDQAALTDFIAAGHFGRHIRRMREVYAERWSILTESARERLAGLLDVSEIEAGLQTVGWLRDGITSAAAIPAAAERKVETLPISRYSIARPAPDGLQLGFAAVDGREIRRGVRDLAAVLEQLRRPRRTMARP